MDRTNCSFLTRGDGARIHFWKDHWIGNIKFKDELYRLDRGRDALVIGNMERG